MSLEIFSYARSGLPVQNGSSIVVNYGGKDKQSRIGQNNISLNISAINNKYSSRFNNDIAYDILNEEAIAPVVSSYSPNYWIPSYDEWYKAAFYKSSGTNAGYWTFATQSNTQPTPIAADAFGNGLASGVGNSANFNGGADWGGLDGNVTTVGTNGGPSAYGTYDQNGNVWEWNDSISNNLRGIGGGDWFCTGFRLSTGGTTTYNPDGSVRQAISVYHGDPSTENEKIGFRVATSSNPLNLPNFVTVADTGNMPDINSAGSVAYNYRIAKYEVTNNDYVEFLNAIAQTDTYGVYNTDMSTVIITGGINAGQPSPSQRGGILRNGSPGSYTYTAKTNMGNKPVNFVNWFDAARYCNWLHNGKPSGLQNYSTTEDGAYPLYGAISGIITKRTVAPTPTPTNTRTPTRTPTLTPSITPAVTATATPTPTTTATPSVTITNTPTNSGTPSVTSTVTPSNTVTRSLTPTVTPTNTVTPSASRSQIITANSANFNNCGGNVSTVGTNGRSSYYGAYDMSGNVWEWTDTTVASLNKVLRGGNLAYNEAYLSSTFQTYADITSRNGFIGFRIGSYNLLPAYTNMTIVGDINNASDSNGFGSVNYQYYISRYEITNDEYVEFLNAVAQIDSYGLYINNMNVDSLGGITRSGTAGSYVYSVKINKNNKPVNFVTWLSCARYCNWLHNGKPAGTGAYATTNDGAYDLSQASNISRKNNATFFMLSENEWYKAAYYKGGSSNAGYWLYATQSNIAPNCVQLTATGDGIPV